MYLWHLRLSLCNIYFRAEEFANSPSILNNSEDSHESLDFILSSVKHWDQHYFSMLVFGSSWTVKFIFLYLKGTHLCKEYNLTELLQWLKYTFFTKGGKQTQTKPNKWKRARNSWITIIFCKMKLQRKLELKGKGQLGVCFWENLSAVSCYINIFVKNFSCLVHIISTKHILKENKLKSRTFLSMVLLTDLNRIVEMIWLFLDYYYKLTFFMFRVYIIK